MGKEVIHNPVTGETLLVMESSADVFKFAVHFRPGGATAAAHIHPTQWQTITVLSGELHCRTGRKRQVIRAGESVKIAPGAAHTQWNPTEHETIAVEELRPADRFHLFFRIVFALAWDGRTNAEGVPDPLIGAAFLAEFKDVLRPARLRHRIFFGLLAPVSRLLGYGEIIRGYIREFESSPARGQLTLAQHEESIQAGIEKIAA